MSRVARSVLTDTFNRTHNYLRISITERCNLRCVYCMPEEGVPLQPSEKLLDRSEILTLARLFASQGVTKIRLTGGEPTVRKDFMEIVEGLGEIHALKDIAITTNGIALRRKLPDLKRFGVTALNISLDTLVEAKYNFFTRRQGLARVLDTIHEAVDVGIPSVKINTVLMRNRNEDEILDFAEMTKDLPVQVRFIEYMPFDGNKWEKTKMFSYFETLETLRSKYELTPIPRSVGDTAKAYTVAGHKGSLGFISSMTSNFCAGCNRLRITADGNLKVCLFGNEEVSLRDLVRAGATDTQLLSAIEAAVLAKKKEHADIDLLKDMKNRPMILIGGLFNGAQHHHHYRHTRVPVPTIPVDRFIFHSDIPVPTMASFQHTGVLPIVRTGGRVSRACYSTFTHVDQEGRAKMVDVGAKVSTVRRAVAEGDITFSNPSVLAMIRNNEIKKGDVLAVARVAGIMAAKQTPNLIPLCHSLHLTAMANDLYLDARANAVRCAFMVECTGKTGVEMEALVGATMTLNTIYDMCKAIDRHMVLGNLKVTQKSGGKHDFDLATD